MIQLGVTEPKTLLLRNEYNELIDRVFELMAKVERGNMYAVRVLRLMQERARNMDAIIAALSLANRKHNAASNTRN
jgi:hypothetical protein